MVSPQYECAYVLSSYYSVRILPYTLGICKASPQYVCAYGLSNYFFCENPFPHSWHLYGFFPVWVSICFFRLLLSDDPAPHFWHLYGFSPAWLSICFFRLLLLENPAPHSWQVWDFYLSTWVLRIRIRVFFSEFSLTQLFFHAFYYYHCLFLPGCTNCFPPLQS